MKSTRNDNGRVLMTLLHTALLPHPDIEEFGTEAGNFFVKGRSPQRVKEAICSALEGSPEVDSFEEEEELIKVDIASTEYCYDHYAIRIQGMSDEEVIGFLEELLKAGWKFHWAGGDLNSFSLSYTKTAYWVAPYVSGATIREMLEQVDHDWKDRMDKPNYGRE